MSASMRRMSAMTASIAALPCSGSSAQSCTYTRVPMIASVRSIQAVSARCGAALASATRLHSLALRKFIRCDGTTRPHSLSARYRRRWDCGNLLNMVTRRELRLGTPGGWLVEQVWAGEAAGSASADTLTALAGKKPLIRRALRPPNFETPLADLAAPFTRNDAFFVRYHLAVVPHVAPAAWRLQIAGASAQRPLTLSLKELRGGFEHVSVVAVNQCAGNRRGLFTPRVPGVQWGNGAMGNAGGGACGCAMCCSEPAW